MKRMLILGLSLLFAACGPRYDWNKDLQYRLATDFCKSRAEVTDYIRKYIPEVTDAQIDAWTASGALEAMEIDGQTRYFRNAGRNLFRIDKTAKARFEAVEGASSPLEGHSASDAVNIPEIIAGGGGKAAPKRIRVKYTLTVKPDVVPAGKTIRCWLPYPRTDVPRQSDVRFISVNRPKPVFSGDKAMHSTVYMEAKSVAGEPTEFVEEFEYTVSGEWYDLEKAGILPYDKDSELFKTYTAERENHMVFTDRIKALADSLTAGIDSPYGQVKAMFEYIDANYPWASAREYSTLDNIPEYVLGAHHGDCGQVTLLLLTMCRYKGIPARFQSGFMMHPDAWNMHDWGELYFEGIGWVPVDMSFGIPPFAKGEYLAENPESRLFYLGGIDSYRMVVNNDYGCRLYPAKKYPRSETVDFQRGEVEWSGGNLYFPDWSWDMEIEYPEDDFRKDIEAFREEVGNVGLAVAFVRDNKIVYHENFGVADLETGAPIRDNSLFRIASISKSFSAVSILQLVEQGLVTLDTDAGTLAGFPVRNPKYPEKVITLEMLMSHTSSLNDSQGYFSFDSVNPSVNPDWALCYNDYEPGTGYEYCNLNYNLIGSFIEKLSGERFDCYVKNHVLEPLGLYGGYCVDSLDAARFVKLYGYSEKEDRMIEKTDAYAARSEQIADYRFGYDTPVFSPTGGMKISACDLARYMMMHMGCGTSPDGVRLISKEHSYSMQTPRSDDEHYGLAMCMTDERIPGVTLVGHTGGAYGLRSAMFFAPDRSFGIVMISSGTRVDESGPRNVINGTLTRMYNHFCR